MEEIRKGRKMRIGGEKRVFGGGWEYWLTRGGERGAKRQEGRFLLLA